MWDPLKLKLEECEFFARQLDAYSRHPKQFLFYLSAFLTSSRSVTFHLQKQFIETGKSEYEALRDEMLSDDVAKYFKDLRNISEKQGYPTVVVGQIVAFRDASSDKKVWTQYASTTNLFEKSDGSGSFLPLEELLRHDWETNSLSGPPAQIEYIWKFPDYPGKSEIVSKACKEFSDRLWEFVFKFRSLWEAENNKVAVLKKMQLSEKLMFPDD